VGRRLLRAPPTHPDYATLVAPLFAAHKEGTEDEEKNVLRPLCRLWKRGQIKRLSEDRVSPRCAKLNHYYSLPQINFP